MKLLTIRKDYLNMQSMINYRDNLLKSVLWRKIHKDPKIESLINQRLSETYSKNITLKKIVDKFIKSIDISENINYFKYTLRPTYLDGISLESLVAFIDHGNSSMRGFHIFSSGLRYTRDYIQLLAPYSM